MNVAILFSGRGTNMRAILDYSFRIPGCSINTVCCITDNPNAAGINIAEEFNIPLAILPNQNKHLISKDQWAAEINRVLVEYEVNLVVLAGYMRILSADFCRQWEGQVINIHPSLLPKYKGLDTHRRAIEAGDEWAGLSIHYVTEEMDGGPLIAQVKVRIDEHDTPDTLASRILEYENALYPTVVHNITEGVITHFLGAVYYKGEQIKQPLQWENFLIGQDQIWA